MTEKVTPFFCVRRVDSAITGFCRERGSPRLAATKLKKISTFCRRLPLDLSGAWTTSILFDILSSTIVGVSSVTSTYFFVSAMKGIQTIAHCLPLFAPILPSLQFRALTVPAPLHSQPTFSCTAPCPQISPRAKSSSEPGHDHVQGIERGGQLCLLQPAF